MKNRSYIACVVCGKSVHRRKTCSDECLSRLRKTNQHNLSKKYYDIFDECVKIHPSMNFKIKDIFHLNQDTFKEIGLARCTFIHYFTFYIVDRNFKRANRTHNGRVYWVPDKWRG